MRNSLRLRTLLATLGVLCLGWHLRGVHHWFSDPYAVWVGWDEAYITAFAQRMIDGHWLPYVDAVSHRGPVLYWLAAAIQSLSDGYSWMAMRRAALLFAEANVLFVFALGAIYRRPLAGFVAAATFVFTTAYAMQPKDGIGFNGEIVAMPFVLLGALATAFALRRCRPFSESRVWLASISGALVMVGALCKQPAGFHLLPLGLWWLATALQDKLAWGKLDLRPLLGLVVGTATPLLAVVAFFVRAGAWPQFSYYLFTYNREVYLGPVTFGYAIESSFLFCRDHGTLLLLTMVCVTWACARFASKVDEFTAASLNRAFFATALSTTTAMQLVVGLVGAFGTFRFWDHYFINVVPWLGLLIGLLLEDLLASSQLDSPQRRARSTLVVLACFLFVSFIERHLTTMWLNGQRLEGKHFGDPEQEPVAQYVREHTSPEQSIFVWGFAPEIYTTSKRRAASRFVFTTFPAGVVPWFFWLSLEQENALAVPGARQLLIRELETERPPLIIDEPSSMRGRSIRRYDVLASYLKTHYCYETTVIGHNERRADMYHRRAQGVVCTKPNPPLPKPK